MWCAGEIVTAFKNKVREPKQNGHLSCFRRPGRFGMKNEAIRTIDLWDKSSVVSVGKHFSVDQLKDFVVEPWNVAFVLPGDHRPIDLRWVPSTFHG